MDTLTAIINLCPFDLGDGSKCHSPKILARGFCEKHYRSLKRAGAFADLAVQRQSKPDVLAANVASVKRARKKLLRLAPDFVDHLATASRISAQNGKHDAAAWALLHTRTVEPVSDGKGQSTVPNTPIINIGVKVSGIGKSDA